MTKLRSLGGRSVLVRLALALMLVAGAAACDDDDNASTTGTTGAGGGGDGLSGEVVVSGSSTVEPISASNAEKFSEDNPDVAISVDGPGTGDGFEIFCAGESDVSDASRAIQEEEVATCEENGIEFIELFVGRDALSVITSPDNTEATCLSFGDLYALLGPESEGFDSWSDANDLAGEVASLEGAGESHAPFPDSDLTVTAPGEESGTFDSFVEIAIEGIAEERGEDATTRADYQASPNDNVIVEGVGGSPSSLGWVGFAFVQENVDVVKPLEVDGGDGCVAPSAETVNDGTYPISRPLFIYVNAGNLEENPALEAYIDFYMSDEGMASVGEVGYVDMTPDELAEVRGIWEAKTTGTREA